MGLPPSGSVWLHVRLAVKPAAWASFVGLRRRRRLQRRRQAERGRTAGHRQRHGKLQRTTFHVTPLASGAVRAV